MVTLWGCTKDDGSSAASKSIDDSIFASVPADKIVDCDPEDVFLSSYDGSEAEQERILDALRENPGDTRARVSRITFLTLRRYKDKSYADEFARHSIWLAKNAPESRAAGCAVSRIDDHSDRFDEVRKVWGEAVKANPKNYRVLKNAADYFTVSDRAFSYECLNTGSKEFPSDFGWHLGLAHLHSLDIQGDEGSDERAAPAKLAFAEQEAAIKLLLKEDGFSSSPQETDGMAELALYAYEAGYADRAKALCEQVLKRTKVEPDTFADEHHSVHQVLGRIALSERDFKAAGRHLVESVNVSGSPVLNSFGPRKRLARLLLEADETESVLNYFIECQKFRSRPEIEAYVNDLKAGRKPNISQFDEP
jgi:hypothetical protein